METISSLEELSSKQLQKFITKAVSVSPEDPLSKIINLLASKKLFEVFVAKGSQIELVTLRNVLRAGNLSERKVSTLTVKPPSLSSTSTVSEAVKAMSDMRIKTVPIVDAKGKLVGSVSSTKILQELVRNGPRGIRVADIMTPHPIRINPSSSLSNARSLMVDNDIDHLPVVREGELVGLVTSLDIVSTLGPSQRDNRLSKTAEPSSRGEGEVAGILTGQPVTCKPSDDALTVLKTILAEEKTAAIVLEDGIRGIVTLRDYVKLLYSLRASTVPIYVVNLPEDDPESSMAESRFRRAVEALEKVYPGIEEARATVKARASTGKDSQRRRVEVQVRVKTPRERFDFTEEGWSLANTFERIALKLKGLRTKPPGKQSHRKHHAEEEFANTLP